MERNPGIFDEIVLRLKKSPAPASPYLQEKNQLITPYKTHIDIKSRKKPSIIFIKIDKPT